MREKTGPLPAQGQLQRTGIRFAGYAAVFGHPDSGGDVIRPFAWVLTFGIVIGTFSSIYVASPLLLWIERKWPRPVGDRGGIGASIPREQRSAPAKVANTAQPTR